MLAVDIAGLQLRSPVILAAGTAGVLDESADVLPLREVGAVTTKSITSRPREGNEAWRVAPLPVGMLNAVGLSNPGIDRFEADHGPRIAALPTAVVVSVAGESMEDFAALVRRAAALPGVAAVELNVSCPNVAHGVDFGTDPARLGELVAACRAAAPTARLFAKLPPVAVATPHSASDLARAAIEPATGGRGVDALVLCNTTPAMAIDLKTRRPVLGSATGGRGFGGGLSGPAVRPIVLRIVHDVHRNIARERGVPIIAVGGVLSWADAAEFILAGATAVQVGTASFADPRAARGIARGLRAWALQQPEGRVQGLVGAAVARSRAGC